MESEIKLIIEKNLPAQVGDVLKTRLAQAEADSVKVKQLEDQLVNRNQYVTKLEAQIAEYKKLDERNSTLSLKETACLEWERSLANKELQYQLVAEKEKTTFVKEVALGLVRNTEYRKNVFDNENSPYKDQYGSTQYNNVTKTLDEKSKAE